MNVFRRGFRRASTVSDTKMFTRITQKFLVALTEWTVAYMALRQGCILGSQGLVASFNTL